MGVNRRQPFIPRRNTSVVLKFLKESLHTISVFVGSLVILSLHNAIGSRRHDRFTARRFDRCKNRIGVIALIGDHRIGPESRKQRLGLSGLRGLPGRKNQSNRLAQRVYGGVNLGAQATTAFALGLAVAFIFFEAPC